MSYNIVVKNQSGKNREYLLFSSPPQPNSSIGKVWSNVWIATGGTPSPNGSQSILINQDTFAICGTSPEDLGNGVMVTESDFAPVHLTGTSSGTKVTMQITNGNPEFQQPPYGTTKKANSFGIHCDTYDPETYPNVLIGMGKYDPKGNVVPAFVFTPDPTGTYDLTPQVTFYISTGSYKSGEVLDITNYGDKATIDFTQAPAGWTKATVIHNRDGTYSKPVFSAPSGQRG